MLVDRRDREPVRPLAFHARDGRELGVDDMELVPAEAVTGRAGGRDTRRVDPASRHPPGS